MKSETRLLRAMNDVGDGIIMDAAYHRRPRRRALIAAAALLTALILTFGAMYASASIRLKNTNAPKFLIIDGHIYKLSSSPSAVLAMAALPFSREGKKETVTAYTADSAEELSAVLSGISSSSEAQGGQQSHYSGEQVEIEPAVKIYSANGGFAAVFRIQGSEGAYSACGLKDSMGLEDVMDKLGVTLRYGKANAVELTKEQAVELKALIMDAVCSGWADEIFSVGAIDSEFLYRHGGVQIDLTYGIDTHTVYWLSDDGLLIAHGSCFVPDEPEKLNELIGSLRPEIILHKNN